LAGPLSRPAFFFERLLDVMGHFSAAGAIGLDYPLGKRCRVGPNWSIRMPASRRLRK
jgi:hypothetical protein